MAKSGFLDEPSRYIDVNDIPRQMMKKFRSPLKTRITLAPRTGVLLLPFREQRILEDLGALGDNSHCDLYRLGISNKASCFRLTGTLDYVALNNALTDLMRRHEILRTTFSYVGGSPIQVVSSNTSPPFSKIDLRHVSDSARRSEALKIISLEAQRQFNLTREPLWRTALSRMTDREHLLLLVINHFISDFWSVRLFIRDFLLLYLAHRSGNTPPLTDLPMQFADYAQWQRATLQGEVLESLTSYWRTYLEGIGGFPILRMPGDLIPPEISSYSLCEDRSIRLTPGATTLLKRMITREGVTLEMVLLAGLAASIYMRNGESDIGIRYTAAKRHYSETSEVIGWFSDRLILRATVSGADSFSALLRQIRDTMLETYEYQDLPYTLFPGCGQFFSKNLFYPTISFSLIAKEAPLTQAAEKEGKGKSHSNLDLKIESMTLPLPESQTLRAPGISVQVFDGEFLNIKVSYEVRRYKTETIVDLLNDYAQVLESVSVNPKQLISGMSSRLNASLSTRSRMAVQEI